MKSLMHHLWAPLSIALIMLAILALCSGCTTSRCADNPRNMSCMSADQLTRELNQ